MTLEDLEKIVNAKAAFQGKKFEKFTTLTDKYLALTGITQLAGGKTIEQLFAAADNKEKEIIAGKLAWCIPGGKGMGGEDALKPKSEVDAETATYTAEEAAAYNLTLEGALQYGAIKTPAVEAVEAKPAIYSFASFNVDTDAPYGTGTVKVISQDLDENVTTVEVLTNEPAGGTTAEDAAAFVGKQYFVHDTKLVANKHYNLYTGIQTPIYVTVELVSAAVESVEAQDAVLYTNEEVDAHNAQLDGAVKAGDEKQ